MYGLNTMHGAPPPEPEQPAPPPAPEPAPAVEVAPSPARVVHLAAPAPEQKGDAAPCPPCPPEKPGTQWGTIIVGVLVLWGMHLFFERTIGRH